MDIRTTVGTRVARAQSSLQSQSASTAKYQQQITSGVKIERPSDGSVEFVTLIDYKARDARLGNYKETINSATLALNSGVNYLTEANSVLTKAFDLGLDGANAATDGPASLAIATEVDAILDRMIDLSNAKNGDSYMFGGTKISDPPFVVTARDTQGRPLAVSYQGSDERSKGSVSQGYTVDTLYPGNRIFQESGGDAFTSLMALRDALRDTSSPQNVRSTNINAALSQIQNARANVQSTMGEQASSLENLEGINTRIDDLRVNIKERIGTLENTDYAEASVKYQEQQNAFQATLLVTSKMFEFSLMDFVR